MTNPNIPPLPRLPHSDPSHTLRPEQKIERRIVWSLLHVLAAAGYDPVTVDNGEPIKVEESGPMASRFLDVMDEVFAVDDCYVYFRRTDRAKEGQQWIRFVLGNGEDVVSDYTCRPGTGFTQTLDAFKPGEAW